MPSFRSYIAQQMKKKKLIILISALVIVVLAATLVLYLVSKNTHFLNFNIPQEAIDENNQNTDIEEPTDLETLVAKTLVVPEKFKAGTFTTARTLNMPEGFEVSLYAAGMVGPRHFVFDSNNNLYLTDKEGGKILVLPDEDGDGVADRIIEIDKGLKSPHGMDLFEGDLYVGETDKIRVYRGIKPDGTYTKKETLISGLPTGGHSTRTVKIGPDRKIYVSIGSSCNVCVESDKRRAAIVRYSLDGKQEKIFAEGLRNTVGFIIKNIDGGFEIWGVDNGRDLIGDNLPVEEVNRIEEDAHYGWPYCHGDGSVNPEYKSRADYCLSTKFPIFSMQAHSAPLGLAFYPDQSDFPSSLSLDVFVTFHGSWNRTIPTGYKVIRIETESTDPEVIDFVTGWLDSTGHVWGRPVGIDFDSNGDMFISDDHAGAVYKITYKK